MAILSVEVAFAPLPKANESAPAASTEPAPMAIEFAPEANAEPEPIAIEFEPEVAAFKVAALPMRIAFVAVPPPKPKLPLLTYNSPPKLKLVEPEPVP